MPVVIYTSYFANKKVPNGIEKISIARTTPEWFEGGTLSLFAPPAPILSDYKNGFIGEAEYVSAYWQYLSSIDPETIHPILPYLDRKVLLCYEKTGDFCHRHVLAKFLNRMFGALVLEYKESYSMAVVGSRGINDEGLVFPSLEEIISKVPIKRVVSGGAEGVDTLARKFALSKKIDVTEIYPEWKRYGKRAGYIRNEEIWKESDFGVAFWDGKSKGTQHSFGIADKQNKQILLFVSQNS